MNNNSFPQKRAPKSDGRETVLFDKPMAERSRNGRTPERNTVIHGDAVKLIPRLPDNSINLVVTSPPYAEKRKDHYPSVAEALYPEWTLRWMETLWDKLTDNGSVLIVIDSHVKQGVESDYVEWSVTALREFGWKKHPPRIWFKPDVMPFGRTDWPRHCYEMILWFSKSARPFCDPKAVGAAMDESVIQKFKALGRTIGTGNRSHVARTTDVVIVPVGGNANGVDHPAKFPQALPEALIGTYCPEGGTVLDPFCGSGTTLLAARKLGRSFYGIDIMREYCEIARSRLAVHPQQEAG